MDLSGIAGGGSSKAAEKAQAPAIEYTAQAASPLINGEVKMVIGDSALTVTALFDAAEIPFAEINGLIFGDYTVTVAAESGDYVFSGMGQWAQPFYDTLFEAYNKAVLRSMFVSGGPVLTASGDYTYTENGVFAGGAAPINVHDDCVVSLPPDLSARRVPLCFVSDMDKGDYSLTLRLDTGESYTYARLGYETVPFADAVEKQLRALRERSLAAVKDIDPSLTAAQASQIARLMPEGSAAPVGKLNAIAPSFVTALEEKLSATRAAYSYRSFRELCEWYNIHIGFRKNEAISGAAAAGLPGALVNIAGGLTGGESPLGALAGQLGGVQPADGEANAPDPYMPWLIAPSPDGKHAAVEFAEADTATFVYRTGGDFSLFASLLNRALEAIDFRREVIRMTDEELRKPENTDYFMASKRTASLQFIRSAFAGRVIHAGADSWKRKLTELWTCSPAELKQAGAGKERPRCCRECGGPLTPDAKFCGVCGTKSACA